jgi:hypothetical protein
VEAERRRIKASVYYAQVMLIENNVVPAAWFIWAGKKRIVWDGPSEAAGRAWAEKNGYTIEWFEPLGSEPQIEDDE